MFWIILLAGVLLWSIAHEFKRIAPSRRAAMGERAKGPLALLIVLSIVLMVIGYRGTPYIGLWASPSFLLHINNTLMLIAIFMMSPAGQKGRLLSKIRHPMQTGFGLFTIAHLLVNGDLASLILFGGLLIWCIGAALAINAAEPEWSARQDGSYKKDAIFGLASLALLVVIGLLHGWLGPWPFPS